MRWVDRTGMMEENPPLYAWVVCECEKRVHTGEGKPCTDTGTSVPCAANIPERCFPARTTLIRDSGGKYPYAGTSLYMMQLYPFV